MEGARRIKAANSANVSKTKDKLSKYNAILEADEEHLLLNGPLGKNNDNNKLPKNWKTTVVASGSNAFGQLAVDQLDLMISTIKQSNVPKGDIEDISCGSTISAVVISAPVQNNNKSKNQDKNKDSYTKETTCYVWGSGLPGPQIRTPTPLAVKDVKFISCGQSHCGLITSNGKVYTWGAGDHGMLGHGTKTAVGSPKQIQSLNNFNVISISCGAFHTALTASQIGESNFVKIPNRTDLTALHNLLRNQSNEGENTVDGSSNLLDRARERSQIEEEFLECGDLYTFGLNKAGQLGQGSGSSMVASPTIVKTLSNDGYRVAKVSCGFHHTLIIAVPVHAIRVFSTSLFSCGWGEHGRLGLGDEDQRMIPTIINFPIPFHPTEITAGEQHSLASGREGCYAWGSNTMGQLGIGNPSTTEFALEPVKIPIPEGMVIKKLAAGGRHSAGITRDGKLLTWGWGEEGQLGHNNEKNSYLPRPCKLPRLSGQLGTPVNVALGMCHTLIIYQNNAYQPPAPVQMIDTIIEKQPIIEEIIPDVEEVVIEEPIELPRVPTPEPPSPIIRHPAVMAEEEVVVQEVIEPVIITPIKVEIPLPITPPEAIRSIRDILNQREEREKERIVKTPPKVVEVISIIEEPIIVEPILEPLIEEPIVIASVIEESITEPITDPVTEKESEVIDDPVEIIPEDKYKIFYKDGMNTEGCLIANSAKRAMERKEKKRLKDLEDATNTGNNTSKTNNITSKERRGSR